MAIPSHVSLFTSKASISPPPVRHRRSPRKKRAASLRVSPSSESSPALLATNPADEHPVGTKAVLSDLPISSGGLSFLESLYSDLQR